MANYELEDDEVILYEGTAASTVHEGKIKLTLTSKRIVFEGEKGFFKKSLEVLDIIELSTIKFYNGVVQIKQKSEKVEIQSTQKNFTLAFSGMMEARKFTGKIIDATTGTSLADRNVARIDKAIGYVDDTLKMDTRETIKGVVTNGVKGTLINGISGVSGKLLQGTGNLLKEKKKK